MKDKRRMRRTVEALKPFVGGSRNAFSTFLIGHLVNGATVGWPYS